MLRSERHGSDAARKRATLHRAGHSGSRAPGWQPCSYAWRSLLDQLLSHQPPWRCTALFRGESSWILCRKTVVAHIRFSRTRDREAIYVCDQTRRVEANLLDDGVGRYVGIKKRNDRLDRAQTVSVFQMSTCRRQAPSSCFHTTTYFGVARWPPARVSTARPIVYTQSPSGRRSSVDSSTRRTPICGAAAAAAQNSAILSRPCTISDPGGRMRASRV